MDVQCGWYRGFSAFRTPTGADVTLFRGPAKSLTLAEFVAVSDSHRWQPIGQQRAPELQRARFAVAFHRARLQDLLDLAASAVVENIVAADGLPGSFPEVECPPPAEVDVKVLVSAPSAPPQLLALTVEAAS